MSRIQTVYNLPAKVKTGTKTITVNGKFNDDGSPVTVVKNVYKKTGKRYPVKQIKHVK